MICNFAHGSGSNTHTQNSINSISFRIGFVAWLFSLKYTSFSKFVKTKTTLLSRANQRKTKPPKTIAANTWFWPFFSVLPFGLICVSLGSRYFAYMVLYAVCRFYFFSTPVCTSELYNFLSLFLSLSLVLIVFFFYYHCFYWSFHQVFSFCCVFIFGGDCKCLCVVWQLRNVTIPQLLRATGERAWRKILLSIDGGKRIHWKEWNCPASTMLRYAICSVSIRTTYAHHIHSHSYTNRRWQWESKHVKHDGTRGMVMNPIWWWSPTTTNLWLCICTVGRLYIAGYWCSMQ